MPPDGPAVPWTVTATGTSLTGTPCGQAAGRLATSSFSGTA